MTSSYTPNRFLEEPAYNDYSSSPTGWTVPMNNNLTAIDSCFGASLSLSSTTGTINLTAIQCRCAIFLVSGTLTGNVTYVIPAGVGGVWSVNNASTGGFSVSFTNATSGSGAYTLPSGWCSITCTGATVSATNTAAGAAGGGNTQLQYNNGGVLAGIGNLTWTPSSNILNLKGSLALLGSTSGYVGLQAPTSGGTGVTWTLPAADGAAGQLLFTNGSGGLYWGGAASGVTSFSAGTTGLSPTTGATGNVVLGGVLGVANGGTGGTSSTGSGAVVLNVNPSITGGMNVTGSLTVTGNIESTGASAILNFVDRTNSTVLGWYATGGFTYLNNSSSNVFSINDTTGDVSSTGGFTAQGAVGGNGQFNALAGSTMAAIKNDGANVYLLKSATSSSAYDTSRPLYVNLSTSVVTIDGGGAGTLFGGSITTQNAITIGSNIYGTSTATAYTLGANPAASITSGGFVQVFGSAYSGGAVATMGAGGNQTLYVTAASAAVNGNFYATGTGYVGESSSWAGSQFEAKSNAGWAVSAWSTVSSGYGALLSRVDHTGCSLAAFYYGASTSVGTINTDGTNLSITAGAGSALMGVNASTLYCTGNITAYYSDKRLKKNVSQITGALAKVGRLSGVYFRPNQAAVEFGFADTGRQVGVLAQQVQEVLPEVVSRAPFDMAVDGLGSKSGENYLTVDYARMVPLLIQAIKELAAKVEDLEAQLATP